MIKHVEGRIIVKVDIEQKNFYTLSGSNITIRLERDYDNLDRKYTQQVLGVVMDAENIPTDALILFHHNSLHETYEVLNHSNLSGKEIASHIKIYSIMERDVFFWKMIDENEWQPTKTYATALRVFKPYTGRISFISPVLIKDTLYITSGEYKGLCCRTIDHADYQITFRCPHTGQDKNIIRLRPNGCEEDQREPEIVAIDHDLTEKINNGGIFIGLTPSDCKHLNKCHVAV